jgi:hypothetical protein
LWSRRRRQAGLIDSSVNIAVVILPEGQAHYYIDPAGDREQRENEQPYLIGV